MADPKDRGLSEVEIESAPPYEDNDIQGHLVPITVRAVGRPANKEVDNLLERANLDSGVCVVGEQLVGYGRQSAQMEEPYRPEQTPDAMKTSPADEQRWHRHGRPPVRKWKGVQGEFFVKACKVSFFFMHKGAPLSPKVNLPRLGIDLRAFLVEIGSRTHPESGVKDTPMLRREVKWLQ